MEKALAKRRLPKTDSIEKLASFWDTHDLTDFSEELEEVKEPVFVQKKSTTVKVTLKAGEARRLKTIASSRGIKDSALLRQWIVEQLQRTSEGKVRGRGSKSPKTPRSVRG